MRVAAGQQRARTQNIGTKEIPVAAPHADFGRNVADEADAAPFQLGSRMTAKDGDRSALAEQALDETPAQKAGPAGDEHGRQ